MKQTVLKQKTLALVAKRAVLLCFSLLLLFSFGGCMYLSPEAAMEGIGTGHSEQARIEFDGGYFYYTTVGEAYADRAGELGDWIYWVTPVQQNEIGL